MAEQDSGPAPGADSWAVYLQSRLVNHLPHSAPLPLRPACLNGGGIVTHTPSGDVQTGPRSSH